MGPTRRDFVKGAMALSGLLATGGCMNESAKPASWITGAPDPDPVKATQVVRTVCLVATAPAVSRSRCGTGWR